MTEFMTWLAQNVNPMWMLIIFPLIISSTILGCWCDHLKKMKREADPRLMSGEEYKHYNRKRNKEI